MKVSSAFITPERLSNARYADVPVADVEWQEDDKISAIIDYSLNPWTVISPEEIYDKFHITGARLGTANRILKDLVDKGFIARNSNNKRVLLAKTKLTIEAQREQFKVLAYGGVKLLRHFMFVNGIDTDGRNNIATN